MGGASSGLNAADADAVQKYNLGAAVCLHRAQGPKVFASMKGATHFECQTAEAGLPNEHGWDGYTQHWFNCHIKGMQNDCDAAYDICNGSPETAKPIAKC